MMDFKCERGTREVAAKEQAMLGGRSERVC